MPTVEELIAQRQQQGSQQRTSIDPIGVPIGYEVTRPRPVPFVGNETVPPTFLEGSDLRLMNQPPEVIARIQQQMVNAGLLHGAYNKGQMRPGDSTHDAYRTLLAYANAIGESDDLRALQRFAASNLGEVKPPRQPFTVRLPNPRDVRRDVEQTTIDKLGSLDVPDQKLEEITSGYQGELRGYQETLAGMQETGGTIVEPPSLETFAEDEIRKANPVAYDAHEALTGFDLLMQFMRGGDA